MSDAFKNLVDVAGKIWRTIGISQKISVLLIAFMTLGAIGAVFYFGSQPDWQVLYANLDEKTAAKVHELVQDENIPVKLKDSGRTIMIPSKYVYSTRLKVSSKGIAVGSSGAGWDLFDDSKMGLTEQQQRIGYQRAIQGELQRAIKKFPEIADARITLVMPKKRTFQKDAALTTASVMLVMNPGAVLHRSQVASIRHLVSSAVESLEPSNITIVNNRGKLLAKRITTEDADGSSSNAQMESKALIEAQLKHKVEEILQPIVGENSVVAVVNVELDFDQGQKTVESFDVKSTVVIHAKTVTEEMAKASKDKAQGIVGASANKTETVNVNKPENFAEGPSSQESRKTTENQYIVPKTIETILKKGSTIKSLSVAVNIAKNKDGKDRDAASIKALEDLVKSAVGAVNNPLKGRVDSVVVKEYEFLAVDKPEQMSVPVLQQVESTVSDIVDSSLVRSASGLVFLFVLFMIYKKVFKLEKIEREDFTPTVNHAASDDLLGELDEIEAVQDEKLKLIHNQSSQEPQMIAKAMENWLMGDN